MLAMAPLLGAATVPVLGTGGLLVFPGLFLLFLARYAALPLATRLAQGKASPAGFLVRRILWTAIYLAGAVSGLAAALLMTPDRSRGGAITCATIVLVLGTFHAGLALYGRDRTVWGELLGMAGLAASAPLVSFAAGNAFWRVALPPGILSFAFYASSLSWVRAYRPAENGKIAVAQTVTWHALLALGLMGAVRAEVLSAPAAYAFLVPLARLAWGIVSPPETIRALGFRELITATAYLLFGSIALGLQP
jgi:hypothetical protein